ncbi:MAG: GNAT family N-acetyltransferase [Oscillospiraceae bacterium]|nr:GNAT family N-acetyltransferase [Oscillospiraceae bacterium]
MKNKNFRICAAETTDEINRSFVLAEKVFMEYEAPSFTKRGVDSFLNFLRGKRVKEMISDGDFKVWVCYAQGASADEELVGMLALREGCHISLAFVRGDFHRQGIGRMLYAEAKKYALSMKTEAITVNASDYGIPFYRAMGFRETDMQLDADGIIYTPMEAKIKKRKKLI